MNNILYERNRKHFSQAHGTPCTMSPIYEEIGFGGNTKWSDEIIDKTATYEKIKNSSLTEILQECGAMRDELPSQIPFNNMIKGFKKWKEKTTTSPSGKHLGIYHVLIKQYEKEQNENKNKTNSETELSKTEKALRIQNMLMNMAIEKTHTYKRWETIYNNFLEKIAGKPLLEKLRVIHIFEAD